MKSGRQLLFLSRLSLVAATVSFLGSLAVWRPAYGQGSEQYTASELALILIDRLTSIQSFDSEWEQRFYKDGELVQERDYRYVRSGDKTRTEESWETADGASHTNFVCYDENQACNYSVTTLADGTQQRDTVQVYDYQQPPIVSPEYLIGTRLSDQLGSLPEVLNNASPNQLAVNDTQLKITGFLSVINDHLSSDYDISCELDPAHGMLPKFVKVELGSKAKAASRTHKDWYQLWRTTEFMEVRDELTGQQRWYPRLGILEQGSVVQEDGQIFHGGRFELEIGAVRLNPNLDASLFNPSIPAGTTIVDVTSRGGGKVTIAGGPGSIDSRIAHLSHDAPGNRSGYLWWFWGNVIAILLVVIVLMIRWRRTHLSAR